MVDARTCSSSSTTRIVIDGGGARNGTAIAHDVGSCGRPPTVGGGGQEDVGRGALARGCFPGAHCRPTDARTHKPC